MLQNKLEHVVIIASYFTPKGGNFAETDAIEVNARAPMFAA